MFESEEMHDRLCHQIKNQKERGEAVDAVRKARNFHFWMNPGTVKLATVHSFKGWEINTLFLVVHGDEASMGRRLLRVALSESRMRNGSTPPSTAAGTTCS
jgi:hypothetical protein